MPQKYEYKPLRRERREIRMLVVHPGEPHDVIRASLVPAFIDTDRFKYSDGREASYETCSYCWGPPRQSVVIFIGRERLTLEIPMTSATVIRRMRYSDRKRTLWIDAVCINQEDLEEKGFQVPLMGEIYQYTRRNLAYLGEEDDNTALAIATLRKVSDQMQANFDNFRSMVTAFFDGAQYTPSREYFPNQRYIQRSCPLFVRKWYSRRWVTQEVVLPPTTVCFFGRHEIKLARIFEAAIFFTLKDHYFGDGPDADFKQPVKEVYLLAVTASEHSPFCVRKAKQRPSLASMLKFAASFQASDPRDLVYGVLGMTRQPSILVPSYTATVEEVYREATRQAIREQGHLTTLALISDTSQRSSSWVVHFDLPPVFGEGDLGAAYMACGDHMALALPSEAEDVASDSNLLHLTGFCVAKVTNISDTLRGDCTDFLGGPLSHMCDLSDTDTLASCLTAGLDFYGMSQEHTRYRSFNEYLHFISTHRRNPPDLKSCAPEQLHIAGFATEVKYASSNHRYYRTSRGGHGLGPKAMQEGDVVCVLHGGEVPVVLRSGMEGAEFRWVGFCYVDDMDLMRGVTANRHAAEGRPFRKFAIR